MQRTGDFSISHRFGLLRLDEGLAAAGFGGSGAERAGRQLNLKSDGFTVPGKISAVVWMCPSSGQPLATL